MLLTKKYFKILVLKLFFQCSKILWELTLQLNEQQKVGITTLKVSFLILRNKRKFMSKLDKDFSNSYKIQLKTSFIKFIKFLMTLLRITNLRFKNLKRKTTNEFFTGWCSIGYCSFYRFCLFILNSLLRKLKFIPTFVLSIHPSMCSF